MASTPTDPTTLRDRIREATLQSEAALAKRQIPAAAFDPKTAAEVEASAKRLVKDARRKASKSGLADKFLQEYGLTNEEGVALMRLAEALLRTPDAATADALIRDKIEAGDWGRHKGKSESFIVNMSTRGLIATAKVLEKSVGESVAGRVRGAVRRLGEPVIRAAVGQAMALMGEFFVLGESIEEAIKKSKKQIAKGYAYSYDMLGEAAVTAGDADKFYEDYAHAIEVIAKTAKPDVDPSENPGISVKLSALHPRYEFVKKERAFCELLPRAAALAKMARDANLGFNLDAEEADRLDISLDLVEALLDHEDLQDWNGFGLVVQAYQRRAETVIDWLADAARRRGRRVMVRLVKGAYWDAEVKRAQTMGLESYPVFTRKVLTDVSYIACARKLFEASDAFYPQIATHNAHTAEAAAALARTNGVTKGAFEFQRLHGMGEAVHERLLKSGHRSRIYAPVGGHTELLPYLVRRLLENGANSSFVNQLFDPELTVDDIIRDPAADASRLNMYENPHIPAPLDHLGRRKAARGFDWTDPATAERLVAATHADDAPTAGPIISGEETRENLQKVENPSDLSKTAGWVSLATAGADRAAILRKAADIMEGRSERLIGLACREAGKTIPDGIAEVREAVDFLRYYADEAETALKGRKPLGVVATISPWNFPLAIFTGQNAAALAAGNTVVAKPAEPTPLIAAEAVRILHEAGVPGDVLHFLPGAGSVVGAAIVEHPAVRGVCFTGSVPTALRIRRSLVDAGKGDAALIAETGGINAMIVDSTALLDQAVKDTIASAFQSAGQRCSAARLLIVQEDVADRMIEMLIGAMAELAVGDPAELATDVGPIIEEKARRDIAEYVESHRREGRVIAEAPEPAGPEGHHLRPALIRVSKVADVEREVFGPVLHVSTFTSAELEAAVDAVNDLGYGLTMGVHTRIDETMERVSARAHVGNVYVNRNQIGAIVGVQPFGGEGLSGTGPKAGGPHYLLRLSQPIDRPKRAGFDLRITDGPGFAPETEANLRASAAAWAGEPDRAAVLRKAADALGGEAGEAMRAAAEETDAVFCTPTLLPGPTGEKNTLRLAPRGVVLCLGGADAAALRMQTARALAAGNAAVVLEADVSEWTSALVAAGGFEGLLTPVSELTEAVLKSPAIDAVALDGDAASVNALAARLAERDGPIVPILDSADDAYRWAHERTLTVNTTAAGGDVELFQRVEGRAPADDRASAA